MHVSWGRPGLTERASLSENYILYRNIRLCRVETGAGKSQSGSWGRSGLEAIHILYGGCIQTLTGMTARQMQSIWVRQAQLLRSGISVVLSEDMV